jgi:hypothetical protein
MELLVSDLSPFKAHSPKILLLKSVSVFCLHKQKVTSANQVDLCFHSHPSYFLPFLMNPNCLVRKHSSLQNMLNPNCLVGKHSSLQNMLNPNCLVRKHSSLKNMLNMFLQVNMRS